MGTRCVAIRQRCEPLRVQGHRAHAPGTIRSEIQAEFLNSEVL